MDSRQLHDAMRDQVSVFCDGKKYERITELVSWYDRNGKRQLSVVLLQGNSVFRVPADKVELAKE